MSKEGQTPVEQPSSVLAAVYFHPEAYSTSGKRLMGRNAAGESFLKGYFKHSRAAEFYCYVQNQDQAYSFGEMVRRYRDKPVKAILKDQLGALTQARTLYYPGPDIGELAFLRSQLNPTGWSLCGITHTTSSAGVMDTIASWLVAPIQPWDAVICTSNAVKSHVEQILQAEVNRLQERLGIQKLSLPQLPVIPLGIHTDDFIFSRFERQAARKSIQADPETIVVLFVGRLSFHAKSHPLAMYQALEAAALNTGKKIKLLECGWSANDYTRKAYVEAAQSICPNIDVIHLDGRDPGERKSAWAAADIFCSFSDNIQETFGITPIEAMAAGLPVVVSDWNGYRETVRHEKDGFRIPTTLPQPGLGGDLAYRYAAAIDNYDYYCGHTCMHIGVDVQKAAMAFIKLIEDVQLRKAMGQSGRERAKKIFDWAQIIPRYEQLWQELEIIRLKAAKKRPDLSSTQPWPARLDPFTGFGHYSTQTLTEESQVQRVDACLDKAIARLDKMLSLEMVRFARGVLPNQERLAALLKKTNASPTEVGNVIVDEEPQTMAINLRALSLLQKLGLIKIDVG